MSKLFFDDEFDALSQTITNSEKKFKECAQFLFPDLSAESQYSTLKNCLNPSHDRKLSFGQIIALCDFCKSYDALMFMCDQLQHERPKARNPDDEITELQRDFVKAVSRADQITARMEQVLAMQSRLKVAS